MALAHAERARIVMGNASTASRGIQCFTGKTLLGEVFSPTVRWRIFVGEETRYGPILRGSAETTHAVRAELQ